MDHIVLADKVTIEHGGFELEVFQLRDQSLWERYGQYRLSQTQILERVDEQSNWISRLQKSTPKQLEALKALGFSGYSVKLKIKGEAKAREAKSLSIADAAAIWGFKAAQGNPKALALLMASTHETIERRADAKFNQTRTEEEYEAQTANRIRRENEPYKALYRKDTCDTAFKWFGCQFYWSYFYCWMTEQERCDLDKRNPPISGRRKTYIHQWIESDTKERLRDKAIELGALILSARSKQQFIELFQNRYGDGWQMDLFN